MRKQKTLLLLCNLFCCILLPLSAQKPATNPVIYADAPDMSMLRVGDTYYMSSTTMHMSPGVPIMKSNDLVNWKLVNYAYDTLANIPTMNLDGGKNTYGRGSWASCLRYHEGVYYLSTFAQTTGKTYFYTTKNLEKGPWKCTEFSPAYHDHSFFFDEDGHIYMIYGNGKLFLAELKPDLSGVKPGMERVLIENASAPAGDNIMLGAEGSQLFKVNGKYYLFNITWPRGGMRTVIVHRADKITGPYEGRVVFQDRGIAQGGLVDTPDGRWFAYLFEDCGAVGRIPYLVPVEWKDGWPVLGVDGRAPAKLELPDSRGLIPGIVTSDDFNRKKGERTLPLVWQWNHNPDNSLWSLSARKGYLRLTTGRVETSFTQAKNMLTQRTIGPVCTGSVSMDVSGMKEGDFAGLSLFQRKYGQVGVKVTDGKKYIVMVNGENEKPMEIEKVPLEQSVIYFKAECDFRNRADKGYFYYSLDGIRWKAIGNVLKMQYTMPHFMGYRFALFNYATKETEGYVDFDYFKIEDKISDCRWADVCYADDELEGHKLDIYLPDTGKSSHKVVVLIYGSAWFANNMKQTAFQVFGKSLLDKGFAVVSINHRSSRDAKFPAQINDVKAAIRFIRANAAKYKLDTSFIGITGFSSGGHLASLAGTTNGVKSYTIGDKTVDLEGNVGEYLSFSSRVDAVVDWFGPIDMTRMENCNTTKGTNSPEATLIGGIPADNLDMLALLNPITYIDKNDPKFIVIHGEADTVVPNCQSIFFSEALKTQGRLEEFISVPGGQHGPVTFNENTFKKMTDFFAKEAGM
jgi:beta-xylosidase/acetyl esterase/lipase